MNYAEKLSLLFFIMASNKLFAPGGDKLETFAVMVITGSVFLLADWAVREKRK